MGNIPPVGPKAAIALVLTVVFFSGACALVHEIVWLRLLRLLFGDTILAVSTLLAAFMAGLAIGSYLLGRLADFRSTSSLRYYGLMEIGIGLYALLIPLLLELLTPAGVWIEEQYRASFYLLSLIRFALSFALLLPATMLMGGTLPVLIRLFAGTASTLGRRSGMLYAINTVGAAAGCISAGFLLIGLWGVHKTIVIAAAFNVAAGSMVLLTAGRITHPLQRNDEIQQQVTEGRSLSEPRIAGALPWIYFCSGFVALALEVLWVRMLAMLTSMHVQSFSVMLAVFLCGIGLGSYVYTKWLSHRIDPIDWLVGLQMTIGAWTLLSVPLFRFVPIVPLPPHGPVPDVDAPAPIIALSMILPSVMLTFVSALSMGVMFPLIVQFYSTNMAKVGRHVGKIYGLNTLGGIFGSFAGGFILLPMLGVHKSMVLLGALSIGLACMTVVFGKDRRTRGLFGPAAASAGVLLCLFSLMGAVSDDEPPVQGFEAPWKLIHYSEGLTASIRVFENAETGVRELFSDSWYIASTDHAAMRLQRMLAHLPLLIHPDPKDLLIIGFGTGTTSGSSMLYDIKTDAVELEATEISSATLFKHVNHRVAEEKWPSNFQLYFDDGRNWLLTHQKHYDVVSRDAHLAKPSQDLFSREFLELAKQRLKPGGIFCGFVPPESTEAVKQMLAAFHDVFPNGSVWYVSPIALLVIGSSQPLNVDYQLLKKRMADPRIIADLHTVNFEEPNDILSSFLMAGDDVGRFVAGTNPASDERPLGFLNSTDFGSPRDIVSLSDDLIMHQTSIVPYLRNLDDSDSATYTIRESLKTQSEAMQHLIRGQLKLLIFRDADAAQAEFAAALRKKADWKEARFQNSNALGVKAEDLLKSGDAWAALNLLQRAIDSAEDYAPHYVLLGRAFDELRQPSLAEESYRKAANLVEAEGYPPIPFIQRRLASGQY